MSASAAGQPHLRLVRSDGDVGTAWHRHEAEQAIAAENRRAAANPGLSPTDPRWVLAVRAYSQLQGSTLTPERRRRLLQLAQRMGVRPFEANMVIAIVQDHARCGRALSEAEPTLSLLSEPQRRSHSSVWSRWIGAALLAVMANLLLIWWLLG